MLHFKSRAGGREYEKVQVTPVTTETKLSGIPKNPSFQLWIRNYIPGDGGRIGIGGFEKGYNATEPTL